ncbi:sulfite exporter TauE/SafE family protein [Paenalcaligenes niemegkensis]|uniref:sulfite exporter TauE/SafE family protein n=1 Tax=Paenalcaligenes niemegkensis TaxID=2895469 RepID=UPI001EE8DB8A|nr:sulfite exporter TauE/SafE family protein [Paenalcaligenes niemegkensis]MCQ9617795.1 sulfite exporter TauE/SafE family protein [Paenalcaligenes niemegkensis]
MEFTTEAYIYFIGAILIAGIVAGLIAGLLGVGGGIVLVPVMFYLFTAMDIDPAVRMHVAVGTSLSTIVATALSSSRAHHSKNAVDMALLKSWGPWLLLGSIIGMSLFSSIKSVELTFVFSGVTFLIAVYMLLGPSSAADEKGALPKGPIRWLSGIVVAGLSSIMGIGGGSLTVPLLSFYRYPMRKAVGTAAAVGLLIAIPGTIGAFLAGLGKEGLPPFSIGYVNLIAFAILIPVTGYFAPIGARIAHAINPKYLRYAFAAFLFFNAVNMLITALRA